MVGIDIVEVERIKNIYQKLNRLFIEKILDDKEINDLLTENNYNFFKKLSCYIAGKEAVFKACSEEALNWKEIAIKNIFTTPRIFIKRPNFRKRIRLSFAINRLVVLAQALVTEK